MTLFSKKNVFFISALFLMIVSTSAQNLNKLWSSSSNSEKSTYKKVKRTTEPNKFKEFHLDIESFKTKLENSPKRKGTLGKSNTIVSFPNAEGELEQFSVFEASIMDDKLQEKYKDIKSYVGKGIDNPGSIIRFSITSMGLHAMILKNTESTVYIDPYTDSKESYLVYSKSDVPLIDAFECKFDDSNVSSSKSTTTTSAKEENANDGNLRTYRLAIATTGEYSQYHLTNRSISSTASDDVKKAAVLEAIVVTMTRVNGIFERDLALTMELVADNTSIIFLEASTDGFTNDDANELIDESQTVIDANIGFDNYDIGHTFSTGGGGLATLNSPCTTSKAKGITGSSSPIGDSYNIDYVAHEMGHQFGAHHTFNGDEGSCSGGNRNDGTAVEPGSGSTIMAYAGICAPQNVQSQSDDYFHLISIREMWANISSGNSSSCAVLTSTGNTAPIVTDVPNYTIPISTPFVLNAEATDVDGDILTYTWEQLDTEITDIPLVSTATGGPAFRSFEPSESSMRYFPALSTVNAGDLSSTWEVLPSVARTMWFGVTVRDNNVAGGQSTSTETTLTVDASSGPFQVSSQNLATTWDAGTAQTITWNVANTNASPINCSFVNILLSTDGGLTYPYTLASNVSNDGEQEVVIPNNSSESAKIKVESVGNVFYAINSGVITIQASEFIMSFDSYINNLCAPADAVYTFTYNTFLDFDETTVFSATGNPEGTTVTFNPASASLDNTSVELTISGITVENTDLYEISIIGTATTATKESFVNLNVYSSTISSPVLTSPENNATNILKPVELVWESDDNVTEYQIDIALDESFLTILETSNVTTNLYSPETLDPDTIYYWRVMGKNSCGESSFSTVFNFKTENETCGSIASSDTPLSIPDNSTTGVSSVINITENKTITDINVTVNITHTWVGDLTLTLVSPLGVSVVLSSNNGDEGDGYVNTIFDYDASTSIGSASAPFTGTFKPTGNLSVFNDEESYGEWTLLVVDGVADDTGQIDDWTIEICGVPIISDDDDKDGVLNDVDLCPNTSLGSTVDATGCAIFSISSDNYTIETVGETCADKNNGELSISANESYSYTANVNGNSYSFSSTNSLNLTSLAPGDYNVCITIAAQSDYEQCYNLTIEEGETISAKASVEASKLTIEVEKGTAPYSVLVNGEEVLQSYSSLFTIDDVKNGDLLQVKTAVTCEGVFEKTISLYDEVIAYPNPTSGSFEIALPTTQNKVVIELYTINSQLISSNYYTVNSGKVKLSLENKPTGLYIAKIYLENPITIKIIKQ